jgi:hypothetical protein
MIIGAHQTVKLTQPTTIAKAEIASLIIGIFYCSDCCDFDHEIVVLFFKEIKCENNDGIWYYIESFFKNINCINWNSVYNIIYTVNFLE